MIDWIGDEGPVELGKLEALCAALEVPLDARRSPQRPGASAAPSRAP